MSCASVPALTSVQHAGTLAQLVCDQGVVATGLVILRGPASARDERDQLRVPARITFSRLRLRLLTNSRAPTFNSSSSTGEAGRGTVNSGT